MQTLSIKTQKRCEMIDITRQVASLLAGMEITSGALHVFSPHTTAGITINEACDPDVAADMLQHLSKLVPRDENFRHAEGNSDAHIKTSLVGPGVIVPVENGKLALGAWQGIFFCEFDGPRNRNVWVQAIKG